MIDPHSNKTTGYHLFLKPTGKLADELSIIIQNLSHEYGGPVFIPHVTLLARIPSGNEGEIIEKTQIVADSLTPFNLTLGNLAETNTYFKALYSEIVEKEEMTKYHAMANLVFSMQDEDRYTPHLSLLYGNYSTEQKEKTIHKLNFPIGVSFFIDRINLYRTEGDTKNWLKMREFELKAPK